MSQCYFYFNPRAIEIYFSGNKRQSFFPYFGMICALVGVLMGLFSLIGLLASLFVGVLVGALAGHIANRFMGTQTSTGRNIVLGILGSFVGEFLFGLIGIHATGSISSFVISVLGACVCIWVDNRLFHDR